MVEDVFLYFGCRRSLVDDLYKMELQAVKKEGVLTNDYTAFSREPDKPKMYVQDYLLQNSSEVYNSIVREEGHFYVCGDAKMAADVTSTLGEILQKERNISAQDAKNLLLNIRVEKDLLVQLLIHIFKDPLLLFSV
ncbi:hypothetical protein CHS0354_042123 [Potamilus streckersoni]|uniref:Oxidoreductase FAD/NAD(P)-binding domain-containing protein n=1 Tax=Potamilus streckersoni TaxID=2493646 RepID=A0AAE0WGG2_9BIVA|nr:hypothetical protein CHS0354_042123 [Potamilus streckersoni]